MQPIIKKKKKKKLVQHMHPPSLGLKVYDIKIYVLLIDYINGLKKM